MTRYVMVADLRRCIGCQTCTAACKQANATPPGVQWRRVLDMEVGEYPNVRRVFVPTGCRTAKSMPFFCNRASREPSNLHSEFVGRPKPARSAPAQRQISDTSSVMSAYPRNTGHWADIARCALSANRRYRRRVRFVQRSARPPSRRTN
jgi:hypothetical protein